MPLSRLTQTFPLDLAEAISGSDASPAGAGLLAFFAGAGAGAGAAGVLAAGLDGIDDLPDAGFAGVDRAAELAAVVSSDDFFWWLFLGVEVSESEAAVVCSLEASALFLR